MNKNKFEKEFFMLFFFLVYFSLKQDYRLKSKVYSHNPYPVCQLAQTWVNALSLKTWLGSTKPKVKVLLFLVTEIYRLTLLILEWLWI